MKHASRAGLFVALALSAACSREGPRGEVRALDREATPLGRASARVEALLGAGKGWEVLSVDHEGSMVVGRPSVAPPASDARRTYEAGYLAKGSDAPRSLGSVLDAALSPAGDRVAVVLASGDLMAGAPGEPLVRVDGDAAAGLAFSPDGSRVAYAKGPAPELDIVIADLARGTTTRVTDDAAPDYLPVFAPDGLRVAFVSGRSGRPSIWTASAAGGEAEVLTNRDAGAKVPAPDGREAPLWGGGLIVFSDGRAVVAVDDREGAVVLSVPDARRPHWLAGGDVAFQRGLAEGAYAAVSLGRQP